MTTAIPVDFLESLRTIVGADHVLLEDLDPYNRDWRNKFVGAALAVVRPADVEQVQAIVRRCADARVAIVPQGGNTGSRHAV